MTGEFSRKTAVLRKKLYFEKNIYPNKLCFFFNENVYSGDKALEVFGNISALKNIKATK